MSLQRGYVQIKRNEGSHTFPSVTEVLKCDCGYETSDWDALASHLDITRNVAVSSGVLTEEFFLSQIAKLSQQRVDRAAPAYMGSCFEPVPDPPPLSHEVRDMFERNRKRSKRRDRGKGSKS